jgi:membrane fusion protein, multidrug efflux system
MVIQPRAVTLYIDFVGQVEAYKQVDLRSKVSGILVRRNFQDGELVEKGQLLYVIDERPYVAALENAKGDQAQSEASLLKADMDVERYTPLYAENAIPKQTLDNAVAQQRVSRAEVESRRAAVRQAELNLEDCTIESPLAGQIGLHQVDEGALVSAGTTPLATLSLNDPAYAYFSISEQDYLKLYEHVLQTQGKDGKSGSGATDPERVESPKAQLLLSGDTLYPQGGQVDFMDRAVSPQTGTITVRALFPNPTGLLKPGLYVKVRLVEQKEEQAVLVPQKAVQEVLGQYFLVVVGQGDVAENRPVKLGIRQGADWLVKGGVSAGERIVVEGLLKARPGDRVKPTVVTEEQLAADPGADKAASGASM